MTRPVITITLTRYQLLAVVISGVVLAVSVLLYVNHVGNESVTKSNQTVRDFCALIITLDTAYQQLPANAPQIQRTMAAEMHDLRTELGCG